MMDWTGYNKTIQDRINQFYRNYTPLTNAQEQAAGSSLDAVKQAVLQAGGQDLLPTGMFNNLMNNDLQQAVNYYQMANINDNMTTPITTHILDWIQGNGTAAGQMPELTFNTFKKNYIRANNFPDQLTPNASTFYKGLQPGGLSSYEPYHEAYLAATTPVTYRNDIINRTQSNYNLAKGKTIDWIDFLNRQ